MCCRGLIAFLFIAISWPLYAQDPGATQKRVESLEDFVEILKADKVNHQANIEDQYVVVPVNKNGLKAAQVIRWAAKDGVVHFIQVIPMKFSDDVIPAVESAMVRLNHSYPIPGLGMNHENNTPYFRLTVPLQPRNYLLDVEVKEYFSFCVNQAVNFVPTLAAVANKEIQPEQVLDYQRSVIQKMIGPLGSWKREFGGSQWSLAIKPNGETTLRRDGKVVVDTMMTLKGNEVTFKDVTGDLAVDEPGVYQFVVEGTTMTFTVVNDQADGRKQVLTSGPWMR